MEGNVAEDRIIAAAGELGQSEFTRAELAERLGVNVQGMKDGFKAARQAGRIEP